MTDPTASPLRLDPLPLQAEPRLERGEGEVGQELAPGRPVSLTLHGPPARDLRLVLSTRCNYRCTFCHLEMCAHESDQEQPLDAGDYRFLYEACQRVAGVQSVTLTGGEPTMRADFGEIVCALHDLGAYITVVTNGSFLRTARALEHVQQFNVSLHSLDAETYRTLTGKRGNLARVKDNIAWLTGTTGEGPRTGKRVHLNAVLLAETQPDGVCDLEDFAATHACHLKMIECFDSEQPAANGHLTGAIVRKLEERGHTRVDGGKVAGARRIVELAASEGASGVTFMRTTCAAASMQASPGAYCARHQDIVVTPSGTLQLCSMRPECGVPLREVIKKRDQAALDLALERGLKSLGEGCPLARA